MLFAPEPLHHLAAARAQRILHLLLGPAAGRISPRHLSQIQAQILLLNLRPHPAVFPAFVRASASLHLLPTALSFLLSSPPSSPPHASPYNCLISAFSHSHHPSSSHHVPFLVYACMLRDSVRPNHYTFPPLLSSLSRLEKLDQGQAVQSCVVKSGNLDVLEVRNSLLGLYCSCGLADVCHRLLFDEMPVRDTVSWTTMISGYRKAGRFAEALTAFRRMLISGVALNMVAVLNALAACADGNQELDLGTRLHGLVMKRGWESDVVVGTCLVNMYGKCGRAADAMKVFDCMSEKNSFTWNSLITGLTSFSDEEGRPEAVKLFLRMRSSGVPADEVTLVAVLKACSHSRLVRMGEWIFQTILEGQYGFLPNIKHYGCMVDMLARAGSLEEALETIEIMPFEPTAVTWRSLLAGCRAHRNFELTELAAKKLMELEPEKYAVYSKMLSNLDTMKGNLDVMRSRKMPRKQGLKDNPQEYFPQLQ